MSHALELRRAGKNYQQIADLTGLSSPQRAQTLVRNAIKRVLKETAEEVRSIELSRIDVLIECLWEKAIRDVEQEKPDYSRFDRLKGLLETKLRWCGAQQVVDQSDKSVSIVIQSFTNQAPNSQLPSPPSSLPSLKMVEQMTEPANVEE